MTPKRSRILLMSLAAVVPLVAWAQTMPKVPRIGMISEFSPSHPFVAAFRQGLRDVGYTEGRNIVVEYRHAHGVIDRVSEFAAELVRLRVEILVVGGTKSAQLANAQTTTIPIVFATSGDPVTSGLVASLAHPGGNATGISILTPELSGKQLELRKAAAPKVSRVAIIYNPHNPAAGDALHGAREAARALSLTLQPLEIRQPKELPGVFSAVAGWPAGAVLVLPDPMLGNELRQISKLAATHRVPAMYTRSEFAETGGLLAYGPSFADNYRRVAIYVDRILKGAKPSNLPVEQPIKFELVINLRTAKALGVTIPQSLILQAERSSNSEG